MLSLSSDADQSAEASATADSGQFGGSVPQSRVLIDFVDAAVARSGDLESARGALVSALGTEAMIDAAAVVACFEMQTRLADATGAQHAAADVQGMDQTYEDLRRSS